ncbi:DUF2860 domain-containing protein [Vibrio sonorensis]|uniref:DUF2860 domain-containing protein n=1 Tax=Vibrio sonorensis TaxID=1004316 RepID=UPI0008DAFC4E|nr:DUF2860 domain-containing protein [Vibrio sonorensis]
MKQWLTLSTLGLLALPTYAELGRAGLSGEISVNAGYSSSSSNLDTGDNEVITSLNQEASSDGGFLLAPLGSLAYTFGQGNNQQLYVGTSREDIAVGTLAFELGYKYQLGSGMILDLSVLPTVMSGEAWKDPYQTNIVRQETDVDGTAYRFKISNVAGLPITLDLAYADKDVEQDELVGTDLARDGNTLHSKVQFRVPLSRGLMLMPSVSYRKHDADGNANSYSQLGGELSLFSQLGNHQLVLTGGYANREYDAGAQIFSYQKRDENDISLFGAYEYGQLMGWSNVSFIMLAGYGKTSSNLDFYDSSQYIVSTGLNFKF